MDTAHLTVFFASFSSVDTADRILKIRKSFEEKLFKGEESTSAHPIKDGFVHFANDFTLNLLSAWNMSKFSHEKGFSLTNSKIQGIQLFLSCISISLLKNDHVRKSVKQKSIKFSSKTMS